MSIQICEDNPFMIVTVPTYPGQYLFWDDMDGTNYEDEDRDEDRSAISISDDSDHDDSDHDDSDSDDREPCDCSLCSNFREGEPELDYTEVYNMKKDKERVRNTKLAKKRARFVKRK
jgi:hypothetical protein